MLDRNKIFGISVLFATLFFIAIAGNRHPNALLYLGFPYALILIFRQSCVRLASQITRPILWYGIAIFLSGLLLEFLAFRTSVFLTAHGQKPFVFYPDSLAGDLLLFGVPHYALIAFGFTWTVRRYDFSIFQLGLAIFLFWAVVMDQFTHFIGLFTGGIPGILGFFQAGFLMLAAFHGPYVIFEEGIRSIHPEGSRSVKKYFFLILFQGAAILLVFLMGVAVSVLKTR
ncbi:MAG: hypothetical protein JNM63_12155 [Spirochaetia bacterium]|nr:hypothetical protein [Spirochaetia bacterium]